MVSLLSSASFVHKGPAVDVDEGNATFDCDNGGGFDDFDNEADAVGPCSPIGRWQEEDVSDVYFVLLSSKGYE